MKRFLVIILILLSVSLVLFYFWASSPTKTDEDHIRISEYSSLLDISSDTFSIMTYNIGYMSGMINNLAIERAYSAFANNINQSYELVNRLQPDIIGFQEIDFYSKRSFKMNQMDSIALNCGYLDGGYAVNWDKNYVPFPYWPPVVHFGKMLSGQGILSRFPILMNKKIVLQKPEENPFWYNAFYLDRLIQISQIDVGQEVVVMNVHLEAFDGETRENQIGSVIAEYERYRRIHPVLLIGDFNCEPPYADSPHKGEKTISSLLKLNDIAQAIPDSVYSDIPDAYFTFDSREPYQKIDYIFYNPSRIKCLEAFVVSDAGEISDHLPVYMKFQLKSKLH